MLVPASVPVFRDSDQGAHTQGAVRVDASDPLDRDQTAAGSPARDRGWTVNDALGLGRLLVDGLTGATHLTEELHGTISSQARRLAGSRSAGVGRIAGLVYRSVRVVTGLAGVGLEAVLTPFASEEPARAASQRADASRAALNGVIGDYLEASGNALAIPMRLRRDGLPLTLERSWLADHVPPCGGRILVLIHGLCLSDRQWLRGGHDHGAALARDLGFAPLYLHYNSGRRISTNGCELSALLDRLVRAWPVPVRQLVLVGHSMGGLVARSAFHQGELAGATWCRQLRAMVFLGTPHHGAPLERAGNWVNRLAEISPYASPLARLGRARSAGIQDLRHGNLLAADWAPHPGDHALDARIPVPLPAGVACYAIAAARRSRAGKPGKSDGWVSVRSALGEHAEEKRALAIPPSHRAVFAGLGHFDLLASAEVYERLRSWLAALPSRRRAPRRITSTPPGR